MKKVLILIGAIIAVALSAGVVAYIGDRMEEKKAGTRKLPHKPYGIYERFIKRPTDCFLATGAMIAISPILLTLTVVGTIAMGGNPFFTQERVGKDGNIFKLIKFRSMSNKKDQNGNLLPDAERLNSYGKALRASSLDELPELANIVKGDMSIIGPRPLLVKYLDKYNSHDMRRHEVRPGLTGLAQANGRNALTWKEKFEKDVEYVEHVSAAMDLKILVLTVQKVLKREGIEFQAGHQPIMDYFAENEQETNI